MADSSSSDPAKADQPGAASSTVQTAVTMLLLLHIFIVLVGTAANSAVGALIYQQLRSGVPGVRPYLQLLYLDTGYTFRLTDGPPGSSEYNVEVEVRRARDDTGKRVAQPGQGEVTQVVALPDEAVWPRQRRIRLMQLKRYLAGQIGGPREAVLPFAIAKYVLRDYGRSHDAVIVCRQQQLVGSADVELHPANVEQNVRQYAEVYRGIAWLVEDDEAVFKKVEQKSRSAQPDVPRASGQNQRPGVTPPGTGAAGPELPKTLAPRDRS